MLRLGATKKESILTVDVSSSLTAMRWKKAVMPSGKTVVIGHPVFPPFR